jgi:glucosylceramidase
MRVKRFIAAAMVVAAVLTVAGGLSGAGATPEHAVRVWMTTGDQKNLLTEQPSSALMAPVDGAPTVTIDPSKSYQQLEGLGASITDSSAHLLAASPYRAAIMRNLFDPMRGLGLSYLRQPMGASDFVVGAQYTYDDMPAGQTDYPQRHFSIAHDEAQILPLLREAKRLNPQLQIVATPWSQPAWMKTNDSLIGGRLIDTPAIYHSYALYMTKFIEAYRSQGVTVNAITVQNEPQNRTPSGYPGTDMSAAQEEKVIEALGPMLRAAGLRTKILAYDHNWSEHPNDVANTPPDEMMDINNYPQEVLSSPAARWVSGTAYHCYSGDPSAMSTLHDAFPTKAIYFTECSGSQSSDPATTFPDTLHWHTRYLTVGSVRNWARTVITWNLALDPSGGPHNHGCGTCFGVVTIDPRTGKATPTADYYVLGHVTRFVAPGAVRIASNVAGNIWNVAFRNPDGSIVLLANDDDWGTGSQTFNVRLRGREFSYNLPAGAIATFVIPGPSRQ